MTPSKESSSDGSSGSDSRPPPRTFPGGGPTAIDKKRLRDKLLSMRAEVLASNKDLADEALKSSGQDFSVDHLADHGSDNSEQDVSLSLLEGETELLQSIDGAIAKIDGSGDLPFGVCEACADDEKWDRSSGAPWIPTPRLEVLPYASLCVHHQEEQEEA